ncbi:MAG: hypothetical protein M3Z23_11965 [Acidobacteriota bacterium]|nr:hypothetical protein [Acidobacteriota bacterium]
MTPIYLSSVAMIGLVVFAGFSNRRSGWRKQRGTVLRDIYEMSAVWKGLQTNEPGLVELPLGAEAGFTVESAANFSSQLVSLHAALNRQGRIIPETIAPLEPRVESKVLA